MITCVSCFDLIRVFIFLMFKKNPYFSDTMFEGVGKKAWYDRMTCTPSHLILYDCMTV